MHCFKHIKKNILPGQYIVNAEPTRTERIFLHHAKRYEGITIDEIKTINNLSTNELIPGTKQKVKVTG